MPKVSIIVPTYNLEDCIETTAGYMLNQSEEDIQIIFVDDGSTDSTKTILENIVSKDDRCILLQQSNKGPGAARNLGLSAASGEYLIFLDGDDVFDQDLVMKMYLKAASTNADIVICGSYIFNSENGVKTSNKVSLRYDLIPENVSCFEPKAVKNNIFQITGAAPWNKLIKRDFFEASSLRFPHWYYAEDMAVVFPLLVRANKIAVVLDELVTYRINRGSSLRDTMDKHWRGECDSLMFIRSDLKANSIYDEYFESFMKRVLFDFDRLFKGYGNVESFSGLFSFAKEKMENDLIRYSEQFSNDSYASKFFGAIIESETPIEFCLKLRKIKKTSELGDIPDRYYKYWKFPYDLIPQNSRVLIYGAGDIGKDMFIQIMQTKWCILSGWVDTFPEKYNQKGFPVEGKDIIKHGEFDYIIIAIKNDETVKKLTEEFRSMGVEKTKILNIVFDSDREKKVLEIVSK